MLKLEEILAKTLYYVIFNNGYRICGSGAALKNHDNTDVAEFKREDWQNQPEELQDFYKAYDYALYELNRTDISNLAAFYNEWVQHPEDFIPQKNKSISLLQDYLVNEIGLTNTVMVENYDGFSVGNSKAGNIYEALLSLHINYEIAAIKNTESYTYIIIQTDDIERLEDLNYAIKQKELEHDMFFGDGKYES